MPTDVPTTTSSPLIAAGSAAFVAQAVKTVAESASPEWTTIPSVVLVPGDEATALGSDPNTRSRDYFQRAKSDFQLSKTEYRETVKLCRNIFKDEGIVGRYVEFLLGLASLGMENSFKRTVTDRYKVAFNDFASRVNQGILSKTKGLDEFQRKFSFEFWTSGLIVTIERVDRMDMSVGNRKVGYRVPVEIDILDPLRIDLDGLYDRNEIGYDLDDDQVKSIKKLGKDAPFLTPYKQSLTRAEREAGHLTRADVAESVQKGKTTVPLPKDKVRIYRRDFTDYGKYPLPFLSACLFALADKSMLRESDRSVLSKIINMILLYKVGQYDKTGKKVNVGDNVLFTAMGSFLQNIQRSKDGRVMIQFAPETHDLSWVMPHVEQLLHEDHYRTANIELVASLIGPAAWQIMSSTARNEDLFFKIVWTQHELFLNVYKRFVEEIYGDIVEWNHMKFRPTDVNLKPRRLTVFDTKENVTMKSNLAQMGWLSVRTALNDAGEDYEAEVQNLIEEKQLRDDEGVLIAIPTFNQISGRPGETPTENPHRRSQGRPPGVVETTPRKGSNDSLEVDPEGDDGA